jgi:hypothetical protein
MAIKVSVPGLFVRGRRHVTSREDEHFMANSTSIYEERNTAVIFSYALLV